MTAFRDERYFWGFGNYFLSEAIPGSLPQRGHNPQKPAFGLYAEQVNGSAFTAPSSDNRRTWLYKMAPSAAHSAFEKLSTPHMVSDGSLGQVAPQQLRWNPIAEAGPGIDFIDGIKTLLVTGSCLSLDGCAVHLYHASRSMDRVFSNSDGEYLMVPHLGTLTISTEMGVLTVAPGEIAVIPRGVRFQVAIDHSCQGYLLENFGAPLRLPERGPIGANGLANNQDFRYPRACYRDEKGPIDIVVKQQGILWQAQTPYHPLDTVAWQGNYLPYAYDLALFNTINTVSYDHPDPSIFTVLTSPTNQAGTANVDFVIFPPRWMVGEETFRPPYFHRNIMSEYMGLIKGVYDAKTGGGFLPGGGSLHNCMIGHGPDFQSWLAASEESLTPTKIKDTLGFMFETSRPFLVTPWALQHPGLQRDYDRCWQGFPRPLLP